MEGASRKDSRRKRSEGGMRIFVLNLFNLLVVLVVLFKTKILIRNNGI